MKETERTDLIQKVVSWAKLAEVNLKQRADLARRIHVKAFGGDTVGVARRFAGEPPGSLEEEAERIHVIKEVLDELGRSTEKTKNKHREGEGTLRQALGWTVLTRDIDPACLELAKQCTGKTVEQLIASWFKLDGGELLGQEERHKIYAYLKLAGKVPLKGSKSRKRKKKEPTALEKAIAQVHEEGDNPIVEEHGEMVKDLID